MLPLIVGMFVVVPIQPYCEGVARSNATPAAISTAGNQRSMGLDQDGDVTGPIL